MNRRTYLASVGTGVASLSGCAATAESAVLPDRSRGEGKPVSVERTVEGDSVEYLERIDEVRWVELQSSDGPVRYKREPFVRWARRKSASIGVEVVLPAIEERLGEPLEGVGRSVESRFFGLTITVDHLVLLDRDGSVKHRPNVTFSELVEIAPRSMNVTVALEGREHASAVPVTVTHAENQGPIPLVFTGNETVERFDRGPGGEVGNP